MIQTIRNILMVFFMATPFAMADLLPDPENLAIDGDNLVWDEVPGATGYNIYLGYGYFQTVKGKTSFKLTQAGTYWVVAFDDAGNFGSQYGSSDQVVEFDGSSDAVSITRNYYSAVVTAVCTDVGPGESCVATCSSTGTLLDPPVYTRYMSGGACSTSDIVEADAFVGRLTYQCTVPTFSGEVVAQAICVYR